MKKRILKPIKNSVVCKKTKGTTETAEENGLYLKKDSIPLYEILEYSVDDKKTFPFEVGDVVMSTSTGDEIEINEGETVYLFKSEHIMCKVLD